jgi:hypothetical protein
VYLVVLSTTTNAFASLSVLIADSRGGRVGARRARAAWTVGLAQPSAVQALLQRYRLHFGNPDISPLGYIFSCTGFTSATPKSARQAFIFIIFYLIIAWNAKT